MNLFESNLYKAISTCDGNLKHCSEFSRIYTFTTENISSYLKYFDLKNKKLLTVGSSGDQILNAYYYGARDITLYDINIYAKYYVYLKIAAILSLNYKEFQEFFLKYKRNGYDNKKMFSIELLRKIKPTLRLLDYESYLFFDELFCLYSSSRIREYLFDDDESRSSVIQEFNVYLQNEINYSQLKSIIKTIKFKYINGDIFKDSIPGTFDNIILSNLCTLTSIEQLKKILKKLDNNHLNNKGNILFAYLWDIDFYTNNYQEEWKEIYIMPKVRENLKEYITDYYQIKSARNILWEENKKNDLVLIYRKNNK